MTKLLHLQVLRAAAALAIATLHAEHDAAALAAQVGQAFSPTAIPLVAGVDVFFVISGFIMVHASRRLFGAPGARRVFLAHRIARIVPLYWAVTTLYLVASLAAPALVNAEQLSPVLVVASYLFVPLARPDGVVQPVYGLGWTLEYEMLFYALFAVAVGWDRRRSLPWLFVALLSLVLVGRLLPSLPATLAFWTDPIVLEFAFGMALGIARENGVRLGPSLRIGMAVAVAALLALDLSGPQGAELLLRPLGYGIPAALLVAAAALGREREARVGLLTRLGVVIGDASYAIYLLHPFVIRAGRELVVRTGLAEAIGPWLYVILSVVLTMVVAVAVHWAFERPVTAWVRRRLEGRPHSLAGSVPLDYAKAAAARARADAETRGSP